VNENLFSLGTALKTAIQSPKLTQVNHFLTIQKYWEIIMGSKHMAEAVTPLKLSKRTLFLLVADAAYSDTLSYYVPDLMALIASEAICGEGIVEKVRFRVGDIPEAPEETPKTVEIKVRKLDSETSDKIKQAASKIEDEELRNIFTKYMTKIKEKEI